MTTCESFMLLAILVSPPFKIKVIVIKALGSILFFLSLNYLLNSDYVINTYNRYFPLFVLSAWAKYINLIIK